MSLDTSNFSTDPAGGDAYKNYRKACQAAIKDINANIPPSPKLNFMMPTAGMGDAIVATIGACVGTDPATGQAIWTNPAAGNLAPDTIELYTWLIAQAPAQAEAEAQESPGQGQAEVESPEVAAAEAAGQPDPKTGSEVTGSEVKYVADGQDCPGWVKSLGPTNPRYKETCDACSRLTACTERAEAAAPKPTASKKTTAEKEAEKEAKAKEKAEAKAKKDAEKAAAKERRKADRAAGKTSGPSKPGVIAAIFALVKAGPVTKEEILTKLTAQFPDRNPDSLKSTISVQLPSRMSKEKGVNIVRNEAKQYFIQA